MSQSATAKVALKAQTSWLLLITNKEKKTKKTTGN